MTNEYVIVEKRELKLRDWEIIFTIEDVQNLLWVKDTLLKFFDKAIHSLQTSLATGDMMWKENEAYLWQRIIAWFKKDVESIQSLYKKRLDEEEAKKEIKE